jgi:hypothetical protein
MKREGTESPKDFAIQGNENFFTDLPRARKQHD